MKTLFFSVMLLGLNKCLAQIDSLPISINIKVDKEYVQTFSKSESFFENEIRQEGYLVDSDSIRQFVVGKRQFLVKES